MKPPHLAVRGSDRLPQLDALRGLAVLLVLVGHSGPVGPVHGAAYVGVGLFFALSGYLITGILLRDWEQHGRLRLARFYGRRIRRLAPALLLFLAVMVLLGQVTPRQTLPSLFYAANIIQPVVVLRHTWSLALEEQFYLVWPMLLAPLLAFRFLRGWVVLGAAGFCIGVSAIAPPEMETLNPAWVGALLAGCAIAIRPMSPPWWLALAGGLTLAWAVTVRDTSAAPMIAVAAPVIVAWLPRTWTLRPLEWLGRISYGVYLYHYPIAVEMRVADVAWVPAFAIVLGASVAIAGASWVLVERPILFASLKQRAFVEDPTLQDDAQTGGGVAPAGGQV